MILLCSEKLELHSGFFTFYLVGNSSDPVGIQVTTDDPEKFKVGEKYFIHVAKFDEIVDKLKEAEYAHSW